MLSRTSLAVWAESQENYHMQSSAGIGGGGKKTQRKGRNRCIWGIRMHKTSCLLIEIWSNIKTSSCFHLVAACQDYLAEEDKTSGQRKNRCQISRALYKIYERKGGRNRSTTVPLGIKQEPVTDNFITSLQSRSLAF